MPDIDTKSILDKISAATAKYSKPKQQEFFKVGKECVASYKNGVALDNALTKNRNNLMNALKKNTNENTDKANLNNIYNISNDSNNLNILMKKTIDWAKVSYANIMKLRKTITGEEWEYDIAYREGNTLKAIIGLDESEYLNLVSSNKLRISDLDSFISSKDNILTNLSLQFDESLLISNEQKSNIGLVGKNEINNLYDDVNFKNLMRLRKETQGSLSSLNEHLTNKKRGGFIYDLQQNLKDLNIGRYKENEIVNIFSPRDNETLYAFLKRVSSYRSKISRENKEEERVYEIFYSTIKKSLSKYVKKYGISGEEKIEFKSIIKGEDDQVLPFLRTKIAKITDARLFEIYSTIYTGEGIQEVEDFFTNYVNSGQFQDTIAFYQQGDSIRKKEDGKYVNVENKIINSASISIKTIMNGLKAITNAFNQLGNDGTKMTEQIANIFTAKGGLENIFKSLPKVEKEITKLFQN